MNVDNYPQSDQLARFARAVQILAGHVVTGLAPSELAKSLNTSAANTTRLLAQMQQLGWAEETRTAGRWRLGPSLVQIAAMHSVGVLRAESEISEIHQRYSRES